MNITYRSRTLPRTSLRAPRRRALAAFAATTAIAIAGLAGTGGSIAATGDGPAAAPSAPVVAVAPAVSTAGAEVAIEPFPGAIEVGRTFGALEQGTLPISPPDRSDTSDDRISHVGLPYRGHVQLLQYRHAPDESPLLIERHYVEQLRAQGFALLTVCEAPCRTASGLEDENAWWARELDPAHQLGTRAFGDRGAYLIAYRRNAVVAGVAAIGRADRERALLERAERAADFDGARERLDRDIGSSGRDGRRHRDDGR